MALPDDLVKAITAFAASERPIVATDFDGVLAPIVLNPMDAAPLPGTVDALRTLASVDGVTAAVVSGRDLATLRRLTGLEEGSNVVLIGSHGAESSEPILEAAASAGLDESATRALESADRLLQRVIDEVPQARIERKPAGVVLHTRGLDEHEAARASSLAVEGAEKLDGVHAMRGKSVIELSVLDVSKGGALAALAVKRGSDATAYLGDDVTDETVFSLLAAGDAHLTVKVGPGDTSAKFRVEGPTDAADVLSNLRDALSAS